MRPMVFNLIKTGKIETVYLNIPITRSNRPVKLNIIFNRNNLYSYADESLAKLICFPNYAKYDRFFTIPSHQASQQQYF